MDKIVAFPDRHSIEAEACEWIARLHGDEPTAEDLAAFREWIGRSPQHRAEMERLAALWSELNVLTELAGPRRQSAVVGAGRWRWPRWLVGIQPLRFGAAALIAGASVFALLLVRQSDDATPWSGRAYTTAVGQQQSISLPDGSSVLLNTDSRIEIDYSDDHRRIHLRRGEAFFRVAHERDRPFDVYAGAGMVRAVGTAFAVRLRPRDIEVSVTEGSVELASLVTDGGDRRAEGARKTTLARIKANQVATFGESIESIEPVTAGALDERLSWQKGVLIFSGEPLHSVVEEVSRYTAIKIVIVDPALRDLPVGGYFKVGETDAMFEALEASFDVHVERIGTDTVQLSRDHS